MHLEALGHGGEWDTQVAEEPARCPAGTGSVGKASRKKGRPASGVGDIAAALLGRARPAPEARDGRGGYFPGTWGS